MSLKKIKSLFVFLILALPSVVFFQNCSDGFSSVNNETQESNSSENPPATTNGGTTGATTSGGTTGGGATTGGGSSGGSVNPPPPVSGELLLASVSTGGFRAVSKESDFSLLSKIFDIPGSLINASAPNCNYTQATIINGKCCIGSALDCYGSGGHSDFLYRSVAFGNGRFVAVGGWSHGIVSTSTDGVTWSQKIDLHSSLNLVSGTNKSASWLSGITYGQNQFVAVSGDGRLYTSPDGNAWSSISTDAGPHSLRKVIFTGNGFLATGDSAFWAFSVDGKTWSSSGALPIPNPDRINDRIVAMDTNQNFVLGIISPSSGAQTRVFRLNLNAINSGWTEVTAIPVAVDTLVYVTERSRFYAFTRNAAYSSMDGMTWVSEPTTLSIFPQHLVYEYGTYFTSSVDGTGCYVVHRSKDISNWQSQKYCTNTAGNYGPRALAIGIR